MACLYRPAAPIIITTDSAMSIAPSAAAMDSVLCSSVSAVTAVWSYVGELVFNLLILVGAIKGCDRIVKEIMGL